MFGLGGITRRDRMDFELWDRAFRVTGSRVCGKSRSLLACSAVVLSAIGTSACGSTSRGSGSASPGSSGASATGGVVARTASGPASTTGLSKHDGDEDIDTLGMGPYDNDLDAVPGYGPQAGRADRQAIVSLIRRYYEAAAAGDGVAACSMLDAPIAESVLEEHHRGKGPRSLQGNTCAQVMSKLFAQRHRELVEDVASFRISDVELRGNRGLVLAPFSATRELQLLVHREHGVWKMNVLLDNSAQ